MQRTLGTIRTALRATSATLLLASAGCAESTPLDMAEPDSPVQGDGSIMMAAFPIDALDCTGTDYPEESGGYTGQCCGRAMCYPPDAGTECEPNAEAKSRFFFGSGLCNCGDVAGPYDPPKDANMIQQGKEGECCYVVPVIGCTGRPLSTDQGHLLAPLVSSSEWIV
jgi:hypothetical protein